MKAHCPERNVHGASCRRILRRAMFPAILALTLEAVVLPTPSAIGQPYPARWPPPGWTEHPEVVYPSGYRRTVQAVPTVQRIYMWPRYWPDVPYPVADEAIEIDGGMVEYDGGMMEYDAGVAPGDGYYVEPGFVPHQLPDGSSVPIIVPSVEAPPEASPSDPSDLPPPTSDSTSSREMSFPRMVWPSRTLEPPLEIRAQDVGLLETTGPGTLQMPPLEEEQPAYDRSITSLPWSPERTRTVNASFSPALSNREPSPVPGDTEFADEETVQPTWGESSPTPVTSRTSNPPQFDYYAMPTVAAAQSARKARHSIERLHELPLLPPSDDEKLVRPGASLRADCEVQGGLIRSINSERIANSSTHEVGTHASEQAGRELPPSDPEPLVSAPPARKTDGKNHRVARVTFDRSRFAPGTSDPKDE